MIINQNIPTIPRAFLNLQKKYGKIYAKETTFRTPTAEIF